MQLCNVDSAKQSLRVCHVRSSCNCSYRALWASIPSYTTGSSHRKWVYHHPDSSFPPPAQKCIQAGRDASDTLPFWHRKHRVVSFFSTTWWLLCFIKDPVHGREASPSSCPLSPCLQHPPSYANRARQSCVQLQQLLACTAMPLPLQRHSLNLISRTHLSSQVGLHKALCVPSFFSTDTKPSLNARQSLSLSSELNVTSSGIKGLTAHLQHKKSCQTEWQEWSSIRESFPITLFDRISCFLCSLKTRILQGPRRQTINPQ